MAKVEVHQYTGWEAFVSFTNMSIGDGLNFLWQKIASYPVYSLYYLLAAYLALKFLFGLLRHFGVTGSQKIEQLFEVAQKVIKIDKID